ncbi:MAG TPA: trypsin-like peptidase domain-containing protein [Candidatus Obscuribacterales bacterium]
MTGKQGQAPILAWIVTCVLAGGLGFFLGEQQKSSVVSHETTASVKPGSVIITDHTVSDIAKDAAKWVVTVETEPVHANEQAHVTPELIPDAISHGAGAGMIIRNDGYVVTSNHVIGLDKDVFVVLNNHNRYPAKIIGRDWFTDVAVIKFDSGNLPVAPFPAELHVEPGDWAVAIGTPMRLDHTVSLGIVSAVGRTISDTSVPGGDLLQTDAAINPGNSGGPLLNIHGEVIGMNTAVHRSAQNIAFAVPIDVVNEVCQKLINDGKIARGYLGLYMSNARQSAPPPFDEQSGVYVILVVKNGPAQKAGVSAGDIIKAVKGKPVETNADIRRLIMPLKPGDKLDMQILHGGALQNVSVLLGEAPEPTDGLRARQQH